MFFFKKKETIHTDLSWLNTDIHSHLLPGIDDGAEDLATSLELINGLVDLGFKKIITTPHVLWEMYPNTSHSIGEQMTELKKELQAQNIKVDLSAAAEYFIDEHLEGLLKAKAPLLTLKDNLVLVEFSMVTAPLDLQEIIFELQLQNYQPVIAHPERYIYLQNKKAFFDDLKNNGCLFQLNLLSITGHYGTSVQQLAEYLIRNEKYDYAGTDMHHAKHLASLQKLSAAPMYNRLQASGQLKNHLL